MSRTADYTIQGFIYQFTVTLHVLLQANINDSIVIEGPIEDIDVATPAGIESTQCKYHEEKEKFTLSSIYKPVLLMMDHYFNKSSQKTKYKLFAHFPSEPVNSKRSLTKEELAKILSSQDTSYKTIIESLVHVSDKNTFLSHFEIEFGPSLGDLQKSTIVLLSKEGFSTQDVEDLFYPNALQSIANLSIKHLESERTVTKDSFIDALKAKKKTAISRWTRELSSYQNLLKRRRDQMRDLLSRNQRIRCLVLDSDFVLDFESKIVNFIEDFVKKYNNKIRLHECPIFCIVGDNALINTIWRRLNEKNVIVERGHVAGEFNVKHFLRKPLKEIKDGRSEFKVRICSYANEFELVEKQEQMDDVYVISKRNIFTWEARPDLNIELIETNEIAEIKYLFQLATTI
ncbi:hypothetical protein [Dyadobacter fermentans]|uniref:Uncharacterized protein n=1 Tax=Dyadobacter fermentans (strain ATCC 700827 / DSM 18053 / CIP 107007 / KCTC 52180 / NS114) TaxID=471854 RepID=C6W3A6_DYAFD|nr:hypothetical protein [Dyadobacter fermentans]ACT92210.1 hypothetical protein Dfer_0960 [Dyadobacter fermentans DSM 18053]